jgi:diadenosine tetraphosphatase ApaH/serine/threonine PP2A family protein phosphatase
MPGDRPSPHDGDAYVFSGIDALSAFGEIHQQVIFFGHTHVPSLFVIDQASSAQFVEVRLLAGERQQLNLEDGKRYLINPGSVGQPRDRNPKAAFAIYDSSLRRLYHYRVPYRVSAARRRILRAGLPPLLGDRILHGV